MLVIVYVTNTKALAVTTADINVAVSSLHSRINDFYIFAGIVITLLLATNIGVYIRTDGEVEKHINENFGKYKKRLEGIVEESEKKADKFLSELKSKHQHGKP